MIGWELHVCYVPPFTYLFPSLLSSPSLPLLLPLLPLLPLSSNSLVMQCGMKRKRFPSLDFDLEQQQQSLFDTSVMKLHQEHLRHGVEPRLLRFVLINNALKLLQMHTLRLEEEDALGSLNYDGTSNRFFSNTFKHGQPSPTPLSPLTPVKNLKLESTFGDQSPLIAATPFQMGDDCLAEEGEGESRNMGGGVGGGGGGGR